MGSSYITGRHRSARQTRHHSETSESW